MTEKLITAAFGLDSASALVDRLSDTSNSYYLFTSRYKPYTNDDSIVSVPVDSEGDKNDVYDKMIFGKRVFANSVSLAVTKNYWASNTVYDQYDSEVDLADLDYFVAVDAGAHVHMFKCLYNSDGVPSTVEPDFDSVSVHDSYMETSDGYIWKYICSTSHGDIVKFETSRFTPITANSVVASAAVSGAIDIIAVYSSGSGYDNYLSGLNSFSVSDLRIGGDPLLYNVSGNTTASTANDFYNGCYLYIKGGVGGEVGQFSRISDYYVNSTSKTIVLDSALDYPISITAVYDIYPGVVITGDGNQTINAAARAIVNSAGNTIQRVDVLNIGAGYRTATASVYAFPDVDATAAAVRVIESPPGGHGSNAYRELGAHAAVVNMTLANTENNTVPASNDYRTIGFLRDPVFADITAVKAFSLGTFISGEDAIVIDPMRIGTDGVLTTSGNTFTSVTGDFRNQFSAGDDIYLASGNAAFSNVVYGNSHSIATVSSVTNATSLALTSNGDFDDTGVSYYIPREFSRGGVVSANSTTLVLDSVTSAFASGDLVVGVTSGAIAVVNSVSRGGVSKGFNTFVNTYKYVGTIVSGTFQEDEVVYQSSIGVANAVFHSAVTSGNTVSIYVTEQLGAFSISQPLRGATSGAIASLTAIYRPELEFRSGEILYVENMAPITRQSDQQETFKIIFDF